MNFPWETAIPQAMQQHGGRNRAVASKPAEAVVLEAAAAPSVTLAPEFESPAEAKERSAREPV